MLAKPEKGRQAEAMLLQMAQTGQVRLLYQTKRPSLISCLLDSHRAYLTSRFAIKLL